AIMLGNETPGVRLVALHTVAAAAQLIFDGIDEIRGATRSIAIAHDEIRLLRYFDSCGPRRLVGAQRARRHGMAIDENGDAKPLPRPVDEPAQARVIRFVEFLDSFNRFLDRHAVRVNLLRLAGHTRDRSQPPRDTQRAR